MTDHLYRDTAVVLRTYKLGEADRIVVLFGQEHGKVRAVAKGVRKTKSRFGSRLEPLSHVKVLMHRGRQLDVVSQAESVDGSHLALGDLDRTTQGLALVEAVELLAPDKEPVPQLYQMLVGALRTLGTTSSPMVVPAFYMKVLASEGVRPELDLCVSCGDDTTLVAFDFDHGGMLCRSCRSGTPVSPAALDVLRLMLGGRLNDVLAMETSPISSEVSHLATHAFEHHIERRLRAVAMFERL
jgi:DNA repair protein RecO (recombination protein O)